MAIDIGGTEGDESPGFTKREVRFSPYRGFRRPPPFDPRTGRNVPLVPDEIITRLPLFTVIEESHDYITCTGYDPYDKIDYTEQNPVSVAKPYLLQRTAFDGQTIFFRDLGVSYVYDTIPGLRVATGGEVTETQRITPDYFAGDIIVAARTRLKDLDNTGITDEDGKRILWVDMNNSGRAWAKEED